MFLSGNLETPFEIVNDCLQLLSYGKHQVK